MTQQDIDRFWKYVKKGGGCWEWQGGIGVGDGYGMFHCGGRRDKHRNLKAHRVSYELNVEVIPKGLWVLHQCDNRKCVRPDHLFAGTQTDNMRDMTRKGRSGVAKIGQSKAHQIAQLLVHTNLYQREIGELYGVTQSTVSLIKFHKIWNF